MKRHEDVSPPTQEISSDDIPPLLGRLEIAATFDSL